MRLPQNAPPRKTFHVSPLLSAFVVSVIVILFAFVLWFVYPKSHMGKDEKKYGAQHDQIAVLYLRHEIKKNPSDITGRLKLIQVELRLGNINHAQSLLRPLSSAKFITPIQRDKYKWVLFQVDFVEATSTKGKRKKNISKKERKNLKVQLAALINLSLTVDQKIELLNQAIQLKAYKEAKALSRRIYINRAQLAYGQMLAVARLDYLAGGFLMSAQFNMSAFNIASSVKEQKKAYLGAIKSLIAGGLLPKYFYIIKKQSSGFTNDTEVMMRLSQAALASENQKLASRWMKLAISLQYKSSGSWE